MPTSDDAPGRAIPHIPALDAVRGVAALFVVALHFGVAADFPGPTRSMAGQLLERALYIGWTGVDLFFVLSGFLITRILLATTGRPGGILTFYGRRTLRIFPLYFGTLVLGLFVLPWVAPGVGARLLGEAPAHQLWLWTYTSNLGAALFGLAAAFGMFGHFWTLAIEEQFYAVWPWIVRWTSRGALVWTCVACVVLGFVVRCAWLGADLGWEGAYRFTFARVDALALGALIATLPAERTRSAPSVLKGGLVVLLLLFLVVDPFYPKHWAVLTLGHLALGITFSAWIVTTLDRPPRWLLWRWLRATGTYAYGIYVWHWPLRELLLEPYQRARSLDPLVNAAQALTFLGVGLGASIAAGWLSYHMFEKHFLRMKRHLPAPPSLAGPVGDARSAG